MTEPKMGGWGDCRIFPSLLTRHFFTKVLSSITREKLSRIQISRDLCWYIEIKESFFLLPFLHYPRYNYTSLLSIVNYRYKHPNPFYFYIQHSQNKAMTRGIQLSTSSSSRSTGKKGALNRSDNIINNGSIIAQFENGRTIDEDGRIGSRGGESLAGGSSRGRREMHDDEREDEARSSPSLTRAARYNARTARKSSVHQVPVALNKRRASLDLQSSDCESVDPTIGSSKASSPRSNGKIFFSTTSYSTLVTITIALLAWSMLQTAQAALSCTVSSDELWLS